MAPRGVGVLLALAQRACDEELTIAEAMRQAEQAGCPLGDDEVYGAVGDIWQAANHGELADGYTRSAVLFAAGRVLRAQRPELWRAVTRGYVRIATELLAERWDAVVYARARQAADDLLAASRGPDELLLAAKLRLEPYAADPVIGDYPVRIGRWLAQQQHVPGRAPAEEMPDPRYPLREAVDLLTEAVDGLTGKERGFALAHREYASFSLAEAGASVDHDDLCEVCLRAWPLVEGEPLASARLCWILARYEQFDRIPSAHYAVYFDEIADMVHRYGVRETVALGAVGVRVFGTRDPALAQWLCSGLLDVVPSDRLEDHRQWLGTHRAHLLPNDPLDCVRAATQPIPTLLDDGRAAGWRAVQLADAALHILAHGAELGESVEALTRVAALSAPGSPPGKHPDGKRQELLDLVVLRRLTLAAVQHDQDGEHSAAAALHLRSATEHALLGYPRSAQICLDNAVRSVLRTSPDSVLVAAAALPDTADVLVGALGPTGAAALHHIYRQVLCLVSEGELDPDAVIVLMQLAKGRGFARGALGAQRASPATGAWEGALARVAQAEQDLGPTNDGVADGDGRTGACGAYLGAYRGPPRILEGSDPAVVVANLRRRCQILDLHHLATGEQAVPLLDTEDLRHTLPIDTALVSLLRAPVSTGLSGGSSGGWHCLVTTSEYDAYLTVTDPRRPGQVEALRRCLATLYADGKRHLVIWPHGTAHLLPFPLLPTGDGRLLADDWTVTVTPSLAPLAGEPGRDAGIGLLAVGCGDHAGPSTESIAASQAHSVAAAFGSTASVDRAGTRATLLGGARRARFVHLAAPWRQCVPTPLFDRVLLSDGPVYAHEILHRDFTGVELVTLGLSAPERGPSTLLRYDPDDNPHGVAAAFLRSGVTAVVGTLWPVSPVVAEYFFTTLYRLLATHGGRVAAFSGAQRATRAAHPHPRDWGAFCFIGDWR